MVTARMQIGLRLFCVKFDFVHQFSFSSPKPLVDRTRAPRLLLRTMELLNMLERATGLDIDGDGDTGVHQDAPTRQMDVPALLPPLQIPRVSPPKRAPSPPKRAPSPPMKRAPPSTQQSSRWEDELARRTKLLKERAATLRQKISDGASAELKKRPGPVSRFRSPRLVPAAYIGMEQFITRVALKLREAASLESPFVRELPASSFVCVLERAVAADGTQRARVALAKPEKQGTQRPTTASAGGCVADGAAGGKDSDEQAPLGWLSTHGKDGRDHLVAFHWARFTKERKPVDIPSPDAVLAAAAASAMDCAAGAEPCSQAPTKNPYTGPPEDHEAWMKPAMLKSLASEHYKVRHLNQTSTERRRREENSSHSTQRLAYTA